MEYCPKCGNPMGEHDKTCGKCGYGEKGSSAQARALKEKVYIRIIYVSCVLLAILAFFPMFVKGKNSYYSRTVLVVFAALAFAAAIYRKWGRVILLALAPMIYFFAWEAYCALVLDWRYTSIFSMKPTLACYGMILLDIIIVVLAIVLKRDLATKEEEQSFDGFDSLTPLAKNHLQ